MTAEVQRRNVRVAADALAGLIRAGHRLVVTHGNGPQVGMLALQGAAADNLYPLDVLGAETEGMIGYMIEQELENALGHDRPVATLLTQVLVDAKDPAFDKPTKFVGPVYEKGEADRLAEARGWRMALDGEKWRRVVASPEPKSIPDMRVLQLLLDQNVVVICTGGGGIPVVELESGVRAGVEAVIDKDRASALLATQLGADALLMLTDVDAVYRDFGTERQQRIDRARPEDFRRLDLPAGAMGPKVEAACRFVESGGKLAAIGRLEDAAALIEGSAGTTVVAS
jgi:carbamate kinase